MIIKFKVYNSKNELIGYERIGNRGQWEFKRTNRNNWLLGTITDGQESETFQRFQFTGKKDCKGVEIYAGDIIEFDANEWGGGHNKFIVEWENTNSEWSYGGGTANDMEWRTVIGHRCENPELVSTLA